jgi:hypothetical protein
VTIDILLEALEELRDNRQHPDYKEHVIAKSIQELKELRDAIPSYLHDLCYDRIHVVFINDAIDIQNANLYDKFGKLAKQGLGDFFHYREIARDTYGFECASTEFLRSGYEVLNDLWHDNENFGVHNPDGTYRRDAEDPG